MPPGLRRHTHPYPKRGEFYWKGIIRKVESLHGGIDKNMTIKKLCFFLRIHRSTIHRAFVETLGVTPGKYIRKIKFDMVKKVLMNDKDLILKNLFIRLGYANTPSASRAFKKYVGVSMRQFKNVLSDPNSMSARHLLKKLWENQPTI